MLQHKNRFFRRVYWTQQPTFANGLTQDDIVQEKLRQLFGVAKRLPFGAVMQASDCDCENLTTFFITCHFTHCNSFYFVSKVKVKKSTILPLFLTTKKPWKHFTIFYNIHSTAVPPVSAEIVQKLESIVCQKCSMFAARFAAQRSANTSAKVQRERRKTKNYFDP